MLNKLKRTRAYTRKQHYTRFILREDGIYGRYPLYLSRPRKKKKAIKRHCERIFYFDKDKGVTGFSRMVLSKPMTNMMLNIFLQASLPVSSPTTITMRRYDA